MMEWLICLTHECRTLNPKRCNLAVWTNCEIVRRLLVDPEAPTIVVEEYPWYGGGKQHTSLQIQDGAGKPAGRYVRTDETGDK